MFFTIQMNARGPMQLGRSCIAATLTRGYLDLQLMVQGLGTSLLYLWLHAKLQHSWSLQSLRLIALLLPVTSTPPTLY